MKRKSNNCIHIGLSLQQELWTDHTQEKTTLNGKKTMYVPMMVSPGCDFISTCLTFFITQLYLDRRISYYCSFLMNDTKL